MCLFSSPPPPPARAAPSPPGLALGVFDGVRVLSLSLVVLGHAFFFPLTISGYANQALDAGTLYKELGKVSMQVIPSAEFAVDTFFVLSGALGGLFVTKAFKSALERKGGSKGGGGGSARRTASTFISPCSNVVIRLVISALNGREDSMPANTCQAGTSRSARWRTRMEAADRAMAPKLRAAWGAPE